MSLKIERKNVSYEEVKRSKVRMILRSSLNNEETVKEIEEKISELYSKSRNQNIQKKLIPRGFFLNPSTLEKLTFMKYILRTRDFNIDNSDIINIAIEVLYLLIESDLNKYFSNRKRKI